MQSELKSLSPPPAFRVLRASALGMCFGVRDAIALAQQHQATSPLTILGDLVHNETVLAELRAGGIRLENRLDEVATPSVMITAHGASEKTRQAIRERGLHVLEATCPLVRHAHQAVKNLVRANYHPIIIGQRDHVEVRGLTGDLAEFDIILTEDDARQLRERPRFGIAAQTTQPIDRVRHLVAVLRHRFPGSEIRFVDTVCQPTKQRQTAATELAQESDVMIVVGGAHSNNTRELAGTCRRFCANVHQVEDAQQLQPAWFHHATTVGLTAGTSTPDHVIDAVEQRLRALAEALALCQ
jgi:4-hydroxy-3-methylbut-2-en-1-yl diphosphate reductase